MLDFVSREIPRFARNDRLKRFFSNLLDDSGGLDKDLPVPDIMIDEVIAETIVAPR